MKIIPLSPALSVEWDKIANSSDDAWLFHLYDWLELEEEAWDLERKSFLVEHEGRFIGIAPLQKNRKNNFLKSDLMGASGVALINGIDHAFREKVLKAAYQHIEEIARENASPGVEIYLPPLAEISLKDRWQINPLIHFHYTDISTHTLIADLAASEEEILSNLSQTARLQLRNAKESGYTVRLASGVDKYYETHCENYQRTGVKPHPKVFFVSIYERICKKGHACVWEALDKNGEPIAFELIALFKSKAFYWSGCCKTGHLQSGVNYLLQVNSMLWAKAQGARWFETGEAFPGAREGKEKGLTDFKEKFGGQLHRLLKGRLDISISSKKASAFKHWVRSSKSLVKTICSPK